MVSVGCTERQSDAVTFIDGLGLNEIQSTCKIICCVIALNLWVRQPQVLENQSCDCDPLTSSKVENFTSWIEVSYSLFFVLLFFSLFFCVHKALLVIFKVKCVRSFYPFGMIKVLTKAIIIIKFFWNVTFPNPQTKNLQSLNDIKKLIECSKNHILPQKSIIFQCTLQTASKEFSKIVFLFFTLFFCVHKALLVIFKDKGVRSFYPFGTITVLTKAIIIIIIIIIFF